MATKLNLDYLLNNKLPVYVTVNAQNGSRSKLILTVFDSGGNKRPIILPASFLPFNLLDYAPAEQLAMSNDLRDYIRKGVLTLKDSKEAEQIIQDNPQELERIRKKESGVEMVNALNNMKKLQSIPTANYPDDLNNNKSEEVFSISPFVLGLVERLHAEDISIHDALAEFKGMQDLLRNNENDCHYILNNVPDGQIKSFINSLLAITKDNTGKGRRKVKNKNGRKLKDEITVNVFGSTEDLMNDDDDDDND